jgi:hypothetical protein
MPGIFAHITDVLVQEILDLREALDFYELQLFQPEIGKVLSPLVCGDPPRGGSAVSGGEC